MSINGIMNQPARPYSPDASVERAPAPRIIAARSGGVSDGDVIDIKAIKAILYLGIRGEVYLPLEETHAIDTRA